MSLDLQTLKALVVVMESRASERSMDAAKWRAVTKDAVGEVMTAVHGQANPIVIREILEDYFSCRI